MDDGLQRYKIKPNIFCIQKAVGIVKDATEKDHNKQYQEAYKLYTASLEYFILALKCKNSELLIIERLPQSI